VENNLFIQEKQKTLDATMLHIYLTVGLLQCGVLFLTEIFFAQIVYHYCRSLKCFLAFAVGIDYGILSEKVVQITNKHLSI
jgi:hypothetical protein